MSTSREIAERIVHSMYLTDHGVALYLRDKIEAALTAATEAGKAEARREENEACAALIDRVWRESFMMDDEQAERPKRDMLALLATAIRSRLSAQQPGKKADIDSGEGGR